VSLDVYLKGPFLRKVPASSGIFIREGGKTKEITREEWDARHPAWEPIVVTRGERETSELWHGNITHNLGSMAGAAGIYAAVWRPGEIGFTKAKDLIEPLETGLQKLRDDPARFQIFNPANGWGNYDLLVEFLDEYLTKCKEFPEADVEVDR
jgi:hypothetical protein